jgi:hypothetical protein
LNKPTDGDAMHSIAAFLYFDGQSAAPNHIKI